MDLTDQPSGIRSGEELDHARVEAFLKDNIPDLQGSLRLRQFPGGASNLTYLAGFDNCQLVLRRPPFGTKAATAHDMGREYKVLSALQGHFPYAPRPLLFTRDESVIGAPFFVMERREGIILRADIPAGILTTPRQVRTLHERFVEVLHELHSLDYEKVGLSDLGRPAGYVKRQVLGWNKRYRAARTPDAPDCEDIMNWLEAKMPPEAHRSAIIHNDYKFDNIVLDPGDPLRIIGILDWEMSTLGDPLVDLGNTLAYVVEKNDPPELQSVRTMPTNVEGALTRREMLDYYGCLSGLTMENYDFYYCFGLFRLAGISQQIYYRYYHGQTRDERFRIFGTRVRILEQRVRQVIAQSAI